MAETAAQRRARVMRERIREAKARTAEREDASSPVSEEGENYLTVKHNTAKRPNEAVTQEETPSTGQPRRIILNRRSSQGNHKVYQRHVLFGLVAAFLVQLAALGKTLPKSGA